MSLTDPVILVSGIPRAGKSSLCDALEGSDLGLTHVPLDRYVLPIPRGTTFLNWIAQPRCIAWRHLMSHLEILSSGAPCYSPRPDWENGGEWLSDGGSIPAGPGRLMRPARVAYLIPGTHAFAFPHDELTVARVFVETPDTVVAQRLLGQTLDPAHAAAVLTERLAPNLEEIRAGQASADLVLHGDADRAVQVDQFRGFLAAVLT